MNSHTVSESNNHSSVYSTDKRNENVTNLSQMENTGMQYGVDIQFMLPAYTLHKYANIEFNN